MKDLNIYINESIFDDEDTQMNKIDNIVDAEKLKKKLTNYKKFRDNMVEFMNEIEKYGKKVPITKLNPMKNYVAFEEVEGFEGAEHHNIILYEGNKHDERWREYIIWSTYFPDGVEIPKYRKSSLKIDLMVRGYEKRYNLGKRRNGIYKYKYIFALPPQYNWMFDWIKKEKGVDY